MPRQLITLIISLCIVYLSPVAAQDQLETVKLQLKWKHQFQFAGYYAAQKQGYYRDMGLNVELLEPSGNEEPIEVLERGDADYAVGTTEILALFEHGENPVLLASIFQHSPAAFLSLKNANDQNIHNIAKSPIMIEPQSTELLAYLYQEGVDLSAIEKVSHDFTTDKLLSGDVGAMTVYITDEVFALEEAGLEYQLFRPISSGIDFYGDNLFALERYVLDNRETTKKFVDASLMGWAYAMNNKQEMVDYIIETYGDRKSRDHLLFEADRMEELMVPDIVPIGFSNPDRWDAIQTHYINLGFLEERQDLKDFFFNVDLSREQVDKLQATTNYLIYGMVIAAIFAGMFAFLFMNVKREIARRKTVEQELQIAVEKAEEANRAKSAFLATIGHEIRTPLTGLMTSAELLEKTQPNPAQKQLLLRLNRAGKNLLHLLNDILDFSKNEGHDVILEERAYNLLETIDDVSSFHRDIIDGKGLDFIVKTDDLPRHIIGDELRLRQVLNNLMNNATKFTQMGSITFEAYPLENQDLDNRNLVCFSVSDTGVGIGEARLETIFDAFSQEESGTARRYGGSGLGLSICKQIVELMGGEILAESVKGEGSVFSVVIPLNETSFDVTTADAPKITPLDILLVDDAEDNRLLLSLLLRTQGHTITTAPSGQKAIDTLKEQHFDLILMDIHMPEMDGLETTRIIRGLPKDRKPDTPIFALTADVTAEAKVSHKAVGMDYTLSKPLQLDSFSRALGQHFAIETADDKAQNAAKESEEEVGILNMETLGDYQSLIGIEAVHDLIDNFEQNAGGLLTQLRQAVKEKDREAFASALHQLNGSAGIIGFEALHRWAKGLHAIKDTVELDDTIKTIGEAEKILRQSLKEARKIQ